MFTVNDGGTKFAQATKAGQTSTQRHKLSMRVFQWRRGQPQGQKLIIEGPEKLISCGPADLSILFTELDLFETPRAQGMLALFKHFDVPDAFVGERLNSVTHSFGNYEWEGVEFSWLHSLCKNVEVEERTIGRNKAHKIKTQLAHARGRALRQADYSWHRSAYLCKVEPRNISVNVSRGTIGNSSTEQSKRVTFLCFGAPGSLERRFEKMYQRWDWEQALREPYIIFQVVLDELYQQIDEMSQRLSGVFGDIEHTILSQAELPTTVAEEVDFLELHTVAKSVIYLNEGADAILLAIESMLTASLTLDIGAPLSSKLLAPRGLRYCKNQFQSTQLRLRSLEKRMGNIIQLAFNLISQHDNRTLQRDSTSMKTIAVMTLLFLPTTTIATIFGTQFFNFGESGDGTRRLHVSRWIWLFAFMSIVVTVVVYGIWILRDWRVKKRLRGESVSLRPDGGWRIAGFGL